MTKHPRRGKFADRELIQKHRERKKIEAQIDTLQKKVDAIKGEIIEEFEARGTKAIEHDGERLTYVQTTRVNYDEEGLRQDLSKAQQRAVFVEAIDLNGLPDNTRKKLIAAVPRSQRAAVTTISLDRDALSQAVQAGEIDPEVVDAHSEVVFNKPYYRSS